MQPQEPFPPPEPASPLPLSLPERAPDGTAPPVAFPPQAPNLPLGLSRRQIIAAFSIAAVSDIVSGLTAFAPPVTWVVDFVTATALFVVLGWQWLLLPGLIMEAVPGLGVGPFWVLVVSAIAVWGSVRPRMN